MERENEALTKAPHVEAFPVRHGLMHHLLYGPCYCTEDPVISRPYRYINMTLQRLYGDWPCHDHPINTSPDSPRPRFKLARTWFLMDLIVVTVDWILTGLAAQSEGAGAAGVARLSKTLRLLRFVRLMRMFRIMRARPDLEARSLRCPRKHPFFYDLPLFLRRFRASTSPLLGETALRNAWLQHLEENTFSQATLTQYSILKITGYIILLQHVIACLWRLLRHLKATCDKRIFSKSIQKPLET